MKYLYQFIVLYMAIHFIWYLFHERNLWGKVSAVLILILFLLRLFLIK
jgi:hypothetical protein